MKTGRPGGLRGFASWNGGERRENEAKLGKKRGYSELNPGLKG
jgi:hypothetical protein